MKVHGQGGGKDKNKLGLKLLRSVFVYGVGVWLFKKLCVIISDSMGTIFMTISTPDGCSTILHTAISAKIRLLALERITFSKQY